jgi:hypothetical protein
VQWAIDGVPVGAPITVTSSTAVTLHHTMPGDGLSHTVTLNVVAPGGCGAISKQIVLPVCQSCNLPVITHTVGHCRPDGTVPVTVTVIYTGGSSSTIIDASMSGSFGTIYGSGTGTLTLTNTSNYNTGTYVVTTAAQGCPPQNYTFTVHDCCPSVQFSNEVCGDPTCNGTGQRSVTIKATVTPHAGVFTSAHLVDDASGAILASGSGTSSFTLTASQSYASGTNSVSVRFDPPLHCPDQHYEFCVPECEGPACFNLHIGVLVFGGLGIFLALEALIAWLAGVIAGAVPALAPLLTQFATLATLTGTANYYVTMAAALVLFFYCLIRWIIKCRSKCIARVLIWQVCLSVMLLLLYVMAACVLLNLLFAALFGLIAYLVYGNWLRKCCVGKCDAQFYTLMAVLATVAQSLGALPITGIWTVVFAAPLWAKLLALLASFLVGRWLYQLVRGIIRCMANCGR